MNNIVTDNSAGSSVSLASGLNAASITPQMICNDIAGMMKRFKAHMASLAESYGLTAIQLYALHAMGGQGGVIANTMGGLANTLHCDASNVTGIVDRLSALELITRQENPRDRRVKTLQLTTKGQRVLAAINDELPGRLNCTALNADERAQFHTLINKINPDITNKTTNPEG